MTFHTFLICSNKRITTPTAAQCCCTPATKHTMPPKQTVNHYITFISIITLFELAMLPAPPGTRLATYSSSMSYKDSMR